MSYIEAHGTGTALGDPIEITGLNQAFQAWTGDTGFCALGSAKSNIGHLEAAAGIAGLTKVVLQMQHGLLAPTLHVEDLNPNINFAQSPFLVQRQLAPWPRPQITLNGVTRTYGRIAGVSSFGAGGANAHVILEEYCAPVPAALPPSLGVDAIPAQLSRLFVLSAGKAEQLHGRVQQLLHAIAQRPLSDADLASMAYTLQVGREAMEERLALCADSIAELQEKLWLFVAGTADSEGLLHGRADKTAVAAYAADKDLERHIADWLQHGNIAPLLGLWVKGLDVDWHRLYGDQRPRRLPLPTYPFAGKRFWLPGAWDRGAHHAAVPLPGALAASIASVTDVTTAPTTMLPAAVVPEAPQPVPVPVTLASLSASNATARHPQQARTKVTLVPLAQPPALPTPVATAPRLTPPASVAAEVRPPATLPPAMMCEALAVSLAEALFLERDEVVLDKPFIDMGLDSVVAVEWVRALNTRYDINLMVARVYDYPTIVALAAFLATVLEKGEAPILPAETVSRAVLSSQLEAAAPATASHPASGTAAAPAATAPVAPLPAPGDAVWREALAVSLAEALFLERDEVALDKLFIDMGLDSVVAVEWVRALNTRYGTSLMVARVYDYPTILALASFLERQMEGPQTPSPTAERLTLDEVLQQVQQGHLDIAQAYQLLQQ